VEFSYFDLNLNLNQYQQQSTEIGQYGKPDHQFLPAFNCFAAFPTAQQSQLTTQHSLNTHTKFPSHACNIHLTKTGLVDAIEDSLTFDNTEQLPTQVSRVEMSEPKSFYFLSKAPHQETKELDGGYNSITNRSNAESNSTTVVPESGAMSLTSWLRDMLGTKKYQAIREQKTRKVPTKVEPKVFFANERTFLAWLHMSVTLSTISMAIVAFAGANHFSQMYGLLLMPVAIAFCAYSLYMYVKRSGMIRRREPGPCKSF
jgi:uncharacterized membrane protein YidH (DUF202 family)